MKEKVGLLKAIKPGVRFGIFVVLDIIYLVVTFFTITIATFGVGAGLIILTMTSFFEMLADEPSYKLYDFLNKIAILLAIIGAVLWLVRG